MDSRNETAATEQISVGGDDGEWCGVTCAMATLDHKWHPVIVDRLLEHEVLRFNGLLGQIDAVTNKTLSVALADLEEKGIVNRTVVDARPVQVEYSLTERGRSLSSVIDALDEWGSTHTELERDSIQTA